ncbi:MAG: hypothetical protein L3J26_11375 [Candidatus Polarisedimenticolaceae bacterium]|nr:hypothetical protein [Candidatus Polarisedimenticolaceae bacterium]
MSLNQTKQNTALWDKHRAKIYSKRGGWRIGKGVYNCGYDMMNELVGEKSYMQIVILNAVGRLPERRLADWLEAAFICLSWPDPRIWCNQIGALNGTMKASVVSATVAGTLAADSRGYGSKPLVDGAAFIQNASVDYNKGLPVAEIVSNECAKYGGRPFITGYARPIAKGDERVVAMECVTKKLGFSIGSHLQLAYKVEAELKEKFSEDMNINGYVSAFLSDNGFSPMEIYQMCTIAVNSGVTACYMDAYDRPAGGFLPLQCGDVAYLGKSARELPVSCP